jgi:hypothetical protein
VTFLHLSCGIRWPESSTWAVVSENGSQCLTLNDDKMTVDDKLIINAMTVLLYAGNCDLKTASDIA